MMTKKGFFISLIISYFISCPLILMGQDIKKVTFAQDPWPPYTFGESGSSPQGGHAVKITKQIFQRLDVEVELLLLPWKRVLLMAEKGEVDGIMLLSKDAKRERYLDYSNVLVRDNDLIWYAPELFKSKWKKDFAWNTFTDLKPYTIGNTLGNSYGNAYQKAVKDLKLDIDMAATDKQNLLKLVKGRIDIFISSEIPALYIINGDPRLKGKIKSGITPFRPEPLLMYTAFSKKSPAKILLPQVNNVIAEMKKEGFIDKVLGTH